MGKQKWLWALCLSLFGLLISARADATHFRYGHIRYRVPDPVNAPKTVEFEVIMGWHPMSVGIAVLSFGDGASTPPTAGTSIGPAFLMGLSSFATSRFLVTHTYATTGPFVASINGCCRPSDIVNAGDAGYTILATVDLSNGNTGNAVSAVPAKLTAKSASLLQVPIVAADPDGAPVHCRFSTQAESGIAPNPPVTPTGSTATLMDTPTGCMLSWDTTGTAPPQQYQVGVTLETLNGVALSTSSVDFSVAITNAATPTCSGGGLFTVEVGGALSTPLTGASPGGGSLLLDQVGVLGALLPSAGTTAASPFVSSYVVMPGPSDVGVHVSNVLYGDAAGNTGFCSVGVVVPPCPSYGQACSVGVGACAKNGVLACNGGSVFCDATPGAPSAELCDGADNDCDGVIDDGDPESGQACNTGLLGACAAGTTACQSGSLTCELSTVPGTQIDVCNGIDDDCDGATDEAYGVGAPCQAGVGACETTGQITCAGPNATTCSAVPGMPAPEVCNGIDDSCDGTTDEGFALGMPCEAGVGACADTGVTVCDGSGGVACDAIPGAPSPEVCGNAIDEDCDGALNNGCADADGDGILDVDEPQYGLDPSDFDTDDDGVGDGEEPAWDEDTDGDGLVNALDADSDNDGLSDGTELGLACDHPDTNLARRACVADADPASTTDPLAADTDGGGATDGSEDANLNGAVDAGEAEPLAAADDGTVADTDGDGLGDAIENTLGSKPNDADSDDDGLLDGSEPNPALDPDGDGLKSASDVDSDDDALFDGLERGQTCDHADTAGTAHCKADGDPSTVTSALAADSDRGGATDASEDQNLNGVAGASDTDPLDSSDDGAIADADGDGLGDALELTLGSDPADADSDDDGAPDGAEHNPSDDTDGDGLRNLLDPDSDGDGLFDGTEMGLGCDDAGTDASAGACIADADPATTTLSLVADTDSGGVLDGDEDKDHDGAVDAGETDPNDASDDHMDPCENGCGEGGNGGGSQGGGGAGGAAGGGSEPPAPGCGCVVAGGVPSEDLGGSVTWLAWAIAIAAVRIVRRRAFGCGI